MKLLSRLVLFLLILLLLYIMSLRYNLRGLKREEGLRHNSSLSSLPIGQGMLRSPPHKTSPTLPIEAEVVLAVVVCGDRLSETLVMLKSAILFSPPAKLKIVVVTEPNLFQDFTEKLTEWRLVMNNSFTFETHKVKFPESGGGEWRKLFKPCASQRLFFPSLLSHLDSVLYVDTDVLFVAPLRLIWSHFGRMNSSQLAALTPEHEDPNTGWYNRFARHPYYGKLGVNSGVMLMNLTRMRDFHWESYLGPILDEFKLKITWGDQDIINIIFHYHPERLYVYDCRHNYRADHCMYMSVCQVAEKEGVRVVHGSRGSFHSERHPVFTALYQALQQFELGSDPYEYLVVATDELLRSAKESNCGQVKHIFMTEMKKYFKANDFFS